MLKKIIDDYNILKEIMLILTAIFLTQYFLIDSSFAQNPSDLSSLSKNNDTTITKPTSDLTQDTDKQEKTKTIPDVTSNISLIITPDIINPLDNEDSQASTEMPSIRTDENTITKDSNDKSINNSNQINQNKNDKNPKVLNLITPSNTDLVDSGDNAITTPSQSITTTPNQGNGNGSSTPLNNKSQTTNSSSQTNDNNNINSKSFGSTVNNQGQMQSSSSSSSLPVISWFDQFFKLFGTK
jgi:hypothetical protein